MLVRNGTEGSAREDSAVVRVCGDSLTGVELRGFDDALVRVLNCRVGRRRLSGSVWCQGKAGESKRCGELGEEGFEC